MSHHVIFNGEPLSKTSRQERILGTRRTTLEKANKRIEALRFQIELVLDSVVMPPDGLSGNLYIDIQFYLSKFRALWFAHLPSRFHAPGSLSCTPFRTANSNKTPSTRL
jgi:hypothetical protein